MNIAVIGTGNRGRGLIKNNLVFMDDVNIVGISEVQPQNLDKCLEVLKEAKRPAPFATDDYNEIFKLSGLDAVIIATGWKLHTPLLLKAMEKGIPAATEVYGAYSEAECWDIVNTYEKTKTPVMMLENCCYGRDELMLLNMVRSGVLGTVVHCEGGYRHDLRSEVGFAKEHGHYRLDDYIERNCENYPTHELGPIANILNIGHGNRMVRLTSFSTKALGLKEFYRSRRGDDCEYLNLDIKQGDIVTTIIECAGGETITMALDTTLPRYYSRRFGVHGTKGMFTEDNGSLFLDSENHDPKVEFHWKPMWGNVENYRDKYEHPIWKKYLREGVKSGHGGIDWLVLRAFIEALEKSKPMPIDVYDFTSWMSVTYASEQSINNGSTAVELTDFTRGKWKTRPPVEL